MPILKKQQSEIRKAYLLDNYVIIAPSRAKRPRNIKEQSTIKRVGTCPFCPDKIGRRNVLEKIVFKI